MTYAKLCKRMQKEEIIDAILVELRKTPKITNRELSLNLKLHRNTISKYRKYIRQNYYKTPEEIVNKIDQRLDEDLETMTHATLLTYRGQLVPKKIEAQSVEEIRELKIHIFKIDEERVRRERQQ